MYKLSRRMQLIYDHLLPGQPVWDLCCDHGYIGLNAYESRQFSDIFFVDQVSHIIENLRHRFLREYCHIDSISQAYFLTMAGEEISQKVFGNLIISGVGTFTMLKILKQLHSGGYLQAEKLLLCPQRDEEKLLVELNQIPHFGYKIRNEHYKIEEKGRIRKLLIFEQI